LWSFYSSVYCSAKGGERDTLTREGKLPRFPGYGGVERESGSWLVTMMDD